jgi:hypothetical protein
MPRVAAPEETSGATRPVAVEFSVDADDRIHGTHPAHAAPLIAAPCRRPPAVYGADGSSCGVAGSGPTPGAPTSAS